MPGKERLNVLVSPQVKERLKHLQEQTDADSVTEVVRKALAIYDHLLEQRSEGAELLLKYPDESVERLKFL